jgi:hypothetical protein
LSSRQKVAFLPTATWGPRRRRWTGIRWPARPSASFRWWTASTAVRAENSRSVKRAVMYKTGWSDEFVKKCSQNHFSSKLIHHLGIIPREK